MTKSQLKRAKRGALGLAAVVFFMVVAESFGLLRNFEQATLDWRFSHFNRAEPPSSELVLIDIDEQSIKNLKSVYGRWPWPRRIYKDMIEFLMAGEPSTILFDVIFSEEQKGTDDDRLFAQAASAFPQVSQGMQFLTESSREGVEHVDLPSSVRERFALKWLGSSPETAIFPYKLHDYALPFDEMLAGIKQLHSVTTDKDADGIFRHMPLIVAYGDDWYPSLTLRALMSRLQNPRVEWKTGQISLFDGDELRWRIPVGADSLYRLNFYRDQARPTIFRMAEVIESAAAMQRGDDPSKWSVNPLNLSGKIILVGASATGLEDLKATPISKAYPGVLLHATAISNALNGDFLRDAPWAIALIALFALSLVSYFCILFFDHIVVKSVLPLLAVASYAGAAIAFFQAQDLVFNMVVPIGGGLLSFVDAFIYVSLIEGIERRRMTGTLSKYLSPDVAQQLAEGGVDPTAEIGQKKELSVMFTDVRGFTTLSEKMAPEEVVAILNEYLGEMTKIVFDHDGTLDKFIGDAVMAFWGAPVENPAHTERAVEAAVTMHRRLAELNAVWVEAGRPKLAMGAGINTGDVIVGNIGSEKRLDYTVIGDNVNLASRLEGLTKYYGVDIILGPKAYTNVAKVYLCRQLDLVRVKGKDEAVAIYEPLTKFSDAGPDAAQAREVGEVFGRGWEAYQAGRFSEAVEFFHRCRELRGGDDGPSELYIERCQDLIAEPPTQWDGVYIAKTK